MSNKSYIIIYGIVFVSVCFTIFWNIRQTQYREIGVTLYANISVLLNNEKRLHPIISSAFKDGSIIIHEYRDIKNQYERFTNDYTKRQLKLQLETDSE